MLVTEDHFTDLHNAVNAIEGGTVSLDALDVDGNGDVSGTLDVHDDAHFYGDLTLDGSLIYSGGGGSDLTDLTVGNSSNTLSITQVLATSKIDSGTWSIGANGELENSQSGTYEVYLDPPLMTPGSVLKEVKIRALLPNSGDTVNLDLEEIFAATGVSGPSNTSKLSDTSIRTSSDIELHTFTLGTAYTFQSGYALLARIGVSKTNTSQADLFTIEWVYEEREY